MKRKAYTLFEILFVVMLLGLLTPNYILSLPTDPVSGNAYVYDAATEAISVGSVSNTSVRDAHTRSRSFGIGDHDLGLGLLGAASGKEVLGSAGIVFEKYSIAERNFT